MIYGETLKALLCAVCCVVYLLGNGKHDKAGFSDLPSIGELIGISVFILTDVLEHFCAACTALCNILVVHAYLSQIKRFPNFKACDNLVRVFPGFTAWQCCGKEGIESEKGQLIGDFLLFFIFIFYLIDLLQCADDKAEKHLVQQTAGRHE
jgi:hypothetical protein